MYSLYTKLQLMVMDRNIMHCMGIFVTPISAVSVTWPFPVPIYVNCDTLQEYGN
jgi:hypothetical protein